jgi:hypothetical protein
MITTLTNGGETLYLKRDALDVIDDNDSVIIEAGETGATVFTLDLLDRLSRASAEPEVPEYASQVTWFFDNPDSGYTLSFRTEEEMGSRQPYRISIDAEDGNRVRVFTYDGSMELLWQVCGFQDIALPLLVVSNGAGLAFCTTVQITAVDI